MSDTVVPTKSVRSRGTRVDCPGCGRITSVFSRGICRTCYKRPEIRGRFVSSRERPECDIAVRNGILTDPVMCPPEAMHNLAKRAARWFQWKLPVEDFEQEGWLELTKCMQHHLQNPETYTSNNLIYQYIQHIRRAMHTWGQSATQKGQVSLTEDVFHFRGLRGGLTDRCYRGTLPYTLQGWEAKGVAITYHALKQYRRRFNQSGTNNDIRNHLRGSVVASEAVLNTTLNTRRAANDMAMVNGEMVFCLASEMYYQGALRTVLCSILTMEMVQCNMRGVYLKEDQGVRRQSWHRFHS